MQLKPFLIAIALAGSLPACSVNLNVNDTQLLGAENSDIEKITAVMTAQQTAWNDGDIDRFMQGYWVSPELRFASGGTVTTGWQETRDRYHAAYANQDAMGELTFSNLNVSVLSSDAAVVHGAWALQRQVDRPSGLFTLIFQRMEGGWKIVSDTTTSAE